MTWVLFLDLPRAFYVCLTTLFGLSTPSSHHLISKQSFSSIRNGSVAFLFSMYLPLFSDTVIKQGESSLGVRLYHLQSYSVTITEKKSPAWYCVPKTVVCSLFGIGPVRCSQVPNLGCAHESSTAYTVLPHFSSCIICRAGLNGNVLFLGSGLGEAM